MIPARADLEKNSRSVVIERYLHFSGSPNNGQTKQIKSLKAGLHQAVLLVRENSFR